MIFSPQSSPRTQSIINHCYACAAFSRIVSQSGMQARAVNACLNNYRLISIANRNLSNKNPADLWAAGFYNLYRLIRQLFFIFFFHLFEIRINNIFLRRSTAGLVGTFCIVTGRLLISG